MIGPWVTGSQMAVTASQISTANSGSVAVKLSGEYWNPHSVSGRASLPYFHGAFFSDINNICALELEHLLPLYFGGGVIHVNDGTG